MNSRRAKYVISVFLLFALIGCKSTPPASTTENATPEAV